MNEEGIVIGISNVNSPKTLERVYCAIKAEQANSVCIIAIGKRELKSEIPGVFCILRPKDSDVSHDSIAVWNAVKQQHAKFGILLNADNFPDSKNWLSQITDLINDGHDVVLPAKTQDALTKLMLAPLLNCDFSAPVADSYAFTHERARNWLKDLTQSQLHPEFWGVLNSVKQDRKISASSVLPAARALPNEDNPIFGKVFKAIIKTAFEHLENCHPLANSKMVVRLVKSLDLDTDINIQYLIDQFEGVSENSREEWSNWMSSDEVNALKTIIGDPGLGINPDLWFEILNSARNAAISNPEDTKSLIDSLLPLYFGRIIFEINSAS